MVKHSTLTGIVGIACLISTFITTGALAQWDNSPGQPGVTSTGWPRAAYGNSDYLYLGGNFTEINGVLANRIVRFDGSGEALYLSGNFTTSGGVSTAYVSRLRGNQFKEVGGGMATDTFGLNIPAIKSMVVWDDGFGSFTSTRKMALVK